jgi:hypothetical protein
VPGHAFIKVTQHDLNGLDREPLYGTKVMTGDMISPHCNVYPVPENP